MQLHSILAQQAQQNYNSHTQLPSFIWSYLTGCTPVIHLHNLCSPFIKPQFGNLKCVHWSGWSRLLMCLIRISDEPKRQRTAKTILGLAHLCMIDNMTPHNILCSSTHISHIIMCWNSAEWVVSVVSHLQMEKYCRKTCSDRQQLLPPSHSLVLPQCSQVEFWEFRGRDTQWLFFARLFISWLPYLVWLAVCQQTLQLV